MKMVSGCLCGINCKYNGGNNFRENIVELCKMEDVIKICPEEMGGAPIHRQPSEIETGFEGIDVLEGIARVFSKTGEDVTHLFLEGAYKLLDLAIKNNVDTIYLKQSSPSCGFGVIYDGTFTGNKKQGNGVAATLLLKNGIKIIPVE